MKQLEALLPQLAAKQQRALLEEVRSPEEEGLFSFKFQYPNLKKM
jgi:hypothetical protein